MTAVRRRAFVTGSGRGLGAAIATRLATDGFEVILHARSSVRAAEELAAKILRSGGKASVVAFDLADSNQMAHAIRSVGHVDVLVNNAALAQIVPFGQISSLDYDQIFEVNLKAPFFLSQYFLPGMVKSSWGRIVNLASIGGEWGGTRQIHYATAKAGLIGLTRSIAKSYANCGITANAISPGLVETDMLLETSSEDELSALVASIPVGRLAQPEEVASAVAFIVSEEASYITGQTLRVNGGMLLA